LNEIDVRLTNLEKLFCALISKMNNDKFYSDAYAAGVSKSISDITPYTQTKTAYIGDTEITFSISTEIQGNITVYFPYEYSMEKEYDRIIITFEPLEEVTDITISIL